MQHILQQEEKTWFSWFRKTKTVSIITEYVRDALFNFTCVAVINVLLSIGKHGNLSTKTIVIAKDSGKNGFIVKVIGFNLEDDNTLSFEANNDDLKRDNDDLKKDIGDFKTIIEAIYKAGDAKLDSYISRFLRYLSELVNRPLLNENVWIEIRNKYANLYTSTGYSRSSNTASADFSGVLSL